MDAGAHRTQVRAANTSMRRTLELDPKTLANALDVIADALRDDTHLTPRRGLGPRSAVR